MAGESLHTESFDKSDNAKIISDYGVRVPLYISGMWPFITGLYFEIMTNNLYSNLRRLDKRYRLVGAVTRKFAVQPPL